MAKGMREIKGQIKSTQNMKQITKAMEMIAASRLRRAQEAAQSARPYTEKLREVIHAIASSSGSVNHPMLQKRPIKKTGYIVITSDRGLAGGYNANLLRRVTDILREKHQSKDEYTVYVIGRKGRDFLRKREMPIAFETLGLADFPRFSDVKEIAAQAVKAFEDGEIDELVLFYNEFISAISQRPVDTVLLPLGVEDGAKSSASYEFEPEPEEVLDHILPRYAETLVFSAVLEGKASEFGARMTAMSNASKNATTMISELTLMYNRARQASITQEITEIVAGANAQG